MKKSENAYIIYKCACCACVARVHARVASWKLDHSDASRYSLELILTGERCKRSRGDSVRWPAPWCVVISTTVESGNLRRFLPIAGHDLR